MPSALNQSMVPVWRPAPFVRLVLPLSVGIILAHNTSISYDSWMIWLCIGTGIFFLSFLLAVRKPFLFGLAFNGLFLALGGFLYQYQRPEHHENFIGKVYNPGSFITATLISPLEPKAKSYRAEATISVRNQDSGNSVIVSGNIILYLAKDSLPAGLGRGSRIGFYKPLHSITNSGNPFAFDYKKYAASNGWFYQVYLKKGEYLLQSPASISAGVTWPEKARSHFIKILRRYIPSPDALGVAEALLTGYKNDMDKELSWQYAGTGVAHIIAISGLHLGMIQAALMLLLSPVRRLRYGSNIRAIVVIVMLWLFAILTGAGPSVLRSALMFSILLLGQVIGKKANPYNGLATSAFLLLMYQPNLLFHVGFQLSYSAVLSIFIFYQPISRWFQFSNKLANRFWQLNALTLSAQVLTLPFIIYYFNQFPVYFLLANLVAVPLSAIILYGLMLLAFLFWWWVPVAAFLGMVVDFLIRFLNSYIAWIHQLPFARIENIDFSLMQVLVLLAMICSLSSWLLLRHKPSAIGGLAFLGLLLLWKRWDWIRQDSNQKMIVYNVNQQSAVDFINGHQLVYWGDSMVISDPSQYRMNLLPSRIFFRASQVKSIPRNDSLFQLLQFGGKRILVLDKELDYKKSGSDSVDILLIAANLRAKPAKILEKITCTQIVADAKLPDYKAVQWQIAADSLHLRFHSVARQGAFIFEPK